MASPESDEYLCTYNIEVEGPTTKILPNTILLHRKKETNTLYTINALNTLIKDVKETKSYYGLSSSFHKIY